MGTVEKRGKNSWRIATQIKVRGEWEWVRMTLRMDPALSEDVQRRDAQRRKAILKQDHLISRSGQGWIECPNLHSLACCILFQVYRLFRLCPGGKAGKFLRKKFPQKCRFSASACAGQNQVALTAAPERIPDTGRC